MTRNEHDINVCVARAIGLEVYETSNRYGTKDTMTWDGKDNETVRPLQNYCGSLDAIHEAEVAKGFDKVSLDPIVSKYHMQLLMVVGDTGGERTWCATICANSAQRTEAFLRVFDKWVWS